MGARSRVGAFQAERRPAKARPTPAARQLPQAPPIRNPLHGDPGGEFFKDGAIIDQRPAPGDALFDGLGLSGQVEQGAGIEADHVDAGPVDPASQNLEEADRLAGPVGQGRDVVVSKLVPVPSPPA